MAVVIVLANSRGGSGALVLYSFAWAVFFVPYAVLAVPIATSAFPELSARSDSFDATSATSTRAVMVASWLGVAGMVGTCIPLARVFQSHAGQAADARQLAIALAAFAPGTRRVRADGEPVPGALRRGAEPGRGPGGQRRLAAGDRGGPADRAVRAALRGGALARGGHHHRADRLGRRAAHPGPPVPRSGRAARLRRGPRSPGWPARWPAPPPGWAWRSGSG